MLFSQSNRASVAASITPPVRWSPVGCSESASISWYRSMVYCCSFATLGSPLMVCMPPAACQVEPEVSSSRSTRTMSVQPSFAKGDRTEQTTPPPPTTTPRAEFRMMSGLLAADLGPPPLDIGVDRFADRGIHRGLHVLL